MTSPGGRLHKLYPKLTARERALAVLAAVQGDRDPDPAIFATMPLEQGRAYHDYAARLERLDTQGRAWLLAIDRAIGESEALAGAIAALTLVLLRLQPVRTYLWLGSAEPITKREYAQRVADARAERWTVDDCAEFLAARDEEVESEDEEPDAVAAETAWARRVAAKRQEVRTAIRRGTLPGEGDRKDARVTVGAFYDWLGEPTPIAPERGLRYDVRPDAEAEEVQRARDLRHGAWEAMERLDALPPRDRGAGAKAGSGGEETRLSDLLARRLRAGVRRQWQELRVIEDEARRVAEELDCDDALMPEVRAVLRRCRERLETLAHDPIALPAPIELPEPDDELRETAGKLFGGA